MDDTVRFRMLFDATDLQVRGYVHRHGPIHGHADDIVAETYLVAWRRLGDVPHCAAGADRELLLPVAWEGVSVTRAARVLGCHPGAARMRLYRARRRLAAELTAREAASGGARAGEPPSGGSTPIRSLLPTTCRRRTSPGVVTPDEALAALRGVRPDDAASPTSPAARTILQEVLSMTLTDRPDAGCEADGSPLVELRLARGPSGGRRRRGPWWPQRSASPPLPWRVP